MNVSNYIDEIISGEIRTLYINSILISTPVYFSNPHFLEKMQTSHNLLADI